MKEQKTLGQVAFEAFWLEEHRRGHEGWAELRVEGKAYWNRVAAAVVEAREGSFCPREATFVKQHIGAPLRPDGGMTKEQWDFESSFAGKQAPDVESKGESLPL